MSGTLYIGSRRYSSWSMRGWLAVQLAGLNVEVRVLRIDGTGASPEVRAISPSGRVPYLLHNGHAIWESLAIAEYCAEITPALWPAQALARSFARAMSAEMASGFRELRIAMPTNYCRTFPGAGATPGALADIARITHIWRLALQRSGGPYLFGPTPTIPDAMFAPIVSRFLTYRPDLPTDATIYCQTIRAHPLVADWYTQAAAEPPSWQIAKYETAPT
jgi:glutathione S-transferase